MLCACATVSPARVGMPDAMPPTLPCAMPPTLPCAPVIAAPHIIPGVIVAGGCGGSRPVALPTINVGGCKMWEIKVCSQEACQLLSGKPRYTRPLKGLPIWEDFKTVVKDARQRLAKEEEQSDAGIAFYRSANALLINASIHSFFHSLIHAFISLVHPSIRPFIHSFIHSTYRTHRLAASGT